MLEVESHTDLTPYIGMPLGSSGWLTIDQQRIDDFARITGDDNWIHVDVDRARRELPDGKTIAHGMLTLSLLAGLGSDILKVRRGAKSINYGSNKVRFTAPVASGARIRLHRTLVSMEMVSAGARLTFGNSIEIEGVERPALVAETISMLYVSP